MDAFVYFCEGLPIGLDELEAALDRALGSRGEVTGAGAGLAGGNIDIVISDPGVSAEKAVELIRSALALFDLPASSQLIVNGERFSLCCARDGHSAVPPSVAGPERSPR